LWKKTNQIINDLCMPRYFFLLLLLLALVFITPVSAANKPFGDAKVAPAGGLMCFTVAPGRDRGATCDALCEAKGAVCVSLKMNGASNPGFGCGDALDPLKSSNAVAGCRCCAVAH
jgi:hypothetical protein